MSERRLTSIKKLDFHPRGRVFPSPVDWREQVIYQLVIDRFDDGRDHPRYDPKSAKQDITLVLNLTDKPWRVCVGAADHGNLRKIWYEGALERTPFGVQIDLAPLGFEIIANDL